jgi:hypothetical protein
VKPGFDAPAIVKALAEATAAQHPDGLRAIDDAELVLDGRKAAGKRVQYSLLGSDFTQEVYALDHPAGGIVALSLQDTLGRGERAERGEPSRELVETKAMLLATFRLTK